jgi:hypothetical protein
VLSVTVERSWGLFCAEDVAQTASTLTTIFLCKFDDDAADPDANIGGTTGRAMCPTLLGRVHVKRGAASSMAAVDAGVDEVADAGDGICLFWLSIWPCAFGLEVASRSGVGGGARNGQSATPS